MSQVTTKDLQAAWGGISRKEAIRRANTAVHRTFPDSRSSEALTLAGYGALASRGPRHLTDCVGRSGRGNNRLLMQSPSVRTLIV